MDAWPHARRYFVEAIKGMPKGRRGHTHEALDMIKILYGIERKIAGQPVEARLAARQTKSVPVLERLREWLGKLRSSVVPGSLLGKALGIWMGNG